MVFCIKMVLLLIEIEFIVITWDVYLQHVYVMLVYSFVVLLVDVVVLFSKLLMIMWNT